MDLRTLPFRLRHSALLTILLISFFAFTSARAFAADPPIPAGKIRIHYHRTDGNYAGWTVYAFDGTTEDTGNYGGGPVQAAGTDAYGAYYDVGISSGTQEVGLILHNPNRIGRRCKRYPEQHLCRPRYTGQRVLGLLGHR